VTAFGAPDKPVRAVAWPHVASSDVAGCRGEVHAVFGEQLHLTPRDVRLDGRIDGRKDQAPAVPAVSHDVYHGLRQPVDKNRVCLRAARGSIAPIVVGALRVCAAGIAAVGCIGLCDRRELGHIKMEKDHLHLCEVSNDVGQRSLWVFDYEHACGAPARMYRG